MRVSNVRLLVRLVVSMYFSSFRMFVSFCVSEYVWLFVWLLSCSSHYICYVSLLLLSVFILWYNRYFYQSSPINFNFIFLSVRWGRIQDIEFERHDLPIPIRCMGKPFKVSINYLGFFVLQKVTFCFCLLFKLSLANPTDADACLCLSFDII